MIGVTEDSDSDSLWGDVTPVEEKILVLSYTNHALDDFLESLIVGGVPKDKVARLGYSPKISDFVRPLCVTQRDCVSFDRSEQDLYWYLKNKQEKIGAEMRQKERHVADQSEVWGIR